MKQTGVFPAIVFAAAAMATMAIGIEAQARSTYPDYVPNAYNLEDKECFVCHTAATGGIDTLNGFGLDVQGSLTGDPPVPDWSAVYDGDSDLDGYTSGYELGDPDGTWTFGDPDPDVTPTNPGDTVSSPCGNGVIELDEACDGDDLQGATCESLGEPQSLQPPVCTNRCVIDPTPCTTEPVMDPDPDMGTDADANQMDVSEADSNNDSGGGGGGCSVREQVQSSPTSPVLPGLVGLAMILGIVWRRR